MWWTWPLFVILIVIAFAIVYQDWIIPSRRKIGYEEMRRSLRELWEWDEDA